MSILYDEGQQAVATESRRVLDARTDKKRLLGLLEQTGGYDQLFWDTAIAQGWTALTLPEAYGGHDLGLTELGIVAQATGAATAGAPFLTTCYGAGQTVLGCGDDDLKSCWLPALATGKAVGTCAFAEGNSPLPRVPTMRFFKGRLAGVKDAVTAGLQADFAIVWAQRDGELVLVFADLAADLTSQQTKVRRVAVESFDNSRGYADLVFADTPATLLAAGDMARKLAMNVLARMAVVTAHEQTGGAEALLHTARDYALTRRAFGQPIGAFQSVKHRIAELYAAVEIARANCIHAAAREGQPDFLRAAAAARIAATQAYDSAARDCTQIHGGIGVTWEQGLHLHMRRARSLAIEQGNLFFWEDVLVDEIVGNLAGAKA